MIKRFQWSYEWLPYNILILHEKINHKWVFFVINEWMIISHMVLMKSLVHNCFHHKTSMTKDKNLETCKCHLYDYEVIIVWNDACGWKRTPSNVVAA
jgi:hypothetical protein